MPYVSAAQRKAVWASKNEQKEKAKRKRKRKKRKQLWVKKTHVSQSKSKI